MSLLYSLCLLLTIHILTAFSYGNNALQSRRCIGQHFECSPGFCIPNRWLCDGIPHCSEGQDEDANTCLNHVCHLQFKCKSGECLTKDSICNGKKECPDGDDENIDICNIRTKKHKCSKEEWEYTLGKCIPNNRLCDKKKECLVMEKKLL